MKAAPVCAPRGLRDLRMIPAQEADRAFFVTTHHAAYRATVTKMFAWDDAQQDALVGAKFDLPGTHVLWLERQRVGVAGLHADAGHVHFRDFFILPEFQNRGIGSAVIVEVQCKARRLGQDIHLRTLRANTRARDFYRHHGFHVSGETPLHWMMAWRVGSS